MQNISVFRCYTCRNQNPRFFVEDLAEQIVYVLNRVAFVRRHEPCERLVERKKNALPPNEPCKMTEAS